MKIKLQKIGIPENPVVETAKHEEYVYGELNEKSVPMEYEIIGHVFGIPEEGTKLSGIRIQRNGVNCPGLFTTSIINKVTEITEKLYRIYTQNSVYILSILADDDEENEDTGKFL